MANALYHQLPDHSYMNLGATGAPAYFKVGLNSGDGQWYPMFSWDGATFTLFQPFATQPLAQAALDQFITNFIAGTIGP